MPSYHANLLLQQIRKLAAPSADSVSLSLKRSSHDRSLVLTAVKMLLVIGPILSFVYLRARQAPCNLSIASCVAPVPESSAYFNFGRRNNWSTPASVMAGPLT